MQQSTATNNPYAIDIFKHVPKYQTKFTLLESYITEDLKTHISEMYKSIFACANAYNEKIIARMSELAQNNLPTIEEKIGQFPIDPSYQARTLDKDYLIGQLYYYLHWIGGRGKLTEANEEDFSAVLDRAVELIDPVKYSRQRNNDDTKEVFIPIEQICEGMSCAGSGERMMRSIFMFVTAMAHTYHPSKISLDFGRSTFTLIPILFAFLPIDIRELTIQCNISNSEQLRHVVLCLREYLSRENPLVQLEMNAGKISFMPGDEELFIPSDEDNLYITYLEESIKQLKSKIRFSGNLFNRTQNNDVSAFLKRLTINNIEEAEDDEAYMNARRSRQAEEQNEAGILESEAPAPQNQHPQRHLA